MMKPLRLLPALVAALLLAPPAQAQDDADNQPQKFSILVTYGDEPCPEATGDEIVVCANRPEADRYRVPKELRGTDDDAAAGGQSWTSAVEGYEDVARQTRPNSCSSVGSYGFSGCTAAMLRQWFAERRTP